MPHHSHSYLQCIYIAIIASYTQIASCGVAYRTGIYCMQQATLLEVLHGSPCFEFLCCKFFSLFDLKFYSYIAIVTLLNPTLNLTLWPHAV